MADRLPPLILSRRPRHVGSAWTDARSWLGGKPRLGERAWPRTSASRPMHFMAQVSLEDIARCIGPSVLPAKGALAFFMGAGVRHWEAGVLHVSQPDAAAATEPPRDLPAVAEVGGDIFPADADSSAPRLFPRWPLDLTALPAGGDESEHQQAVAKLFTRRQYFFSAKQAFEALGAAPRPYWWHTAQLFAQHLRTALRHLPARVEQHQGFLAASRAQLDKLRPKPSGAPVFGRRGAEKSPELEQAEETLRRCEAKATELQRLTPEFRRFVAELSAWSGAVDPWRPMPALAVEQLKAAFERARGEFAELARYRVPHALEDLETETLLALMTADEPAFATLPDGVRGLVNRSYLLPTQTWHQMFGEGVDIQGNAAVENEGNILLLQLVYDDMIGWRFGDMGAYQFWIPPADLAAGEWKAARVTFECH